MFAQVYLKHLMVPAWFQGSYDRPPLLGCAMLQSKPIKYQQKEADSKILLNTYAEKKKAILIILMLTLLPQQWGVHTSFILRQTVWYLPGKELVQDFLDHSTQACLMARAGGHATPVTWGCAQGHHKPKTDVKFSPSPIRSLCSP